MNNLESIKGLGPKTLQCLNNLGITCGNKSCHENIPNLKPTLMKNFILGLFDGDGSISIGKKVNEWSIVSSLEMVTFIKEFLENETNIKFCKISKNGNGKNLYRIRTFSKKNISILYHYFYDNNSSKDYLERKYLKMKKFN